MLFKFTLVLVVCVILLDPSDARNKTKIKIKNGKIKITIKTKRNVKRAIEPPKEIGCQALFSVGCPLGVAAAGTAIAGGTAGKGTAVAAFGVDAGKEACTVGEKKNCNRSVDMNIDLVPFSDDIRDYDVNGDKHVDYEEFVFAVLRTVNLVEPTELRRPFTFADVNDDGMLDTQEFIAAPFFFAHVEHYTSTGKVNTA